MDKNKLLSIIVPVYKAESYLSKCIDSILSQTYKNLEIILVDDGSPDKCPEICDDYASKDDRIIVIHKQNGGVASARNYGLLEAKGLYIGFVDSDDFIEKDMYESLVKAIEDSIELVSCVSCGIFRFIGESRSILEQQNLVLGSESMLNSLLSDKVFPLITNKIFRSSSINNLRFDETLKSGEDLLFLCDYAKQMEKENSFFLEIDKVFYNYRLAGGSLSQNRGNYYYSMLAMDKIAENIPPTSSNYDLAQNRLLSYYVIGLYARYVYNKTKGESPLFDRNILNQEKYKTKMSKWGIRHKCFYLLMRYMPKVLKSECIYSLCTKMGEVPPYC